MVRYHIFMIAERTLLAAGVFLLLIYAAALAHREVGSRLALQEFDRAYLPADSPTRFASSSARKVEASVKSGGPSQARRSASNLLPIAILRIDKMDARIPVFEGTSRAVLNLGAGWLNASSRPGEDGNTVIAGHRDSFFRILKDVAKGDSIELSTAKWSMKYTVDQIAIVSPNNIDLLRRGNKPTLTLVTCYPFYFVGAAPKRYIIRAIPTPQVNKSEFQSSSISVRNR